MASTVFADRWNPRRVNTPSPETDMIDPRELHYSRIHPETIKREWQERGCWVVETTGLCDSEVGYPPGLLVCAPDHGTSLICETVPKWGMDYLDAMCFSRFFPSREDMDADPDWFNKATYGRLKDHMPEGSAWEAFDRPMESVEAGGCAPPVMVPKETLQDRYDARKAELEAEEKMFADLEKFIARDLESTSTDSGDTTEVNGEQRVTSASGGAKGTKPCQLGWIPPFVMEELGKLYGLGGEKYGDPLNYIKGYDWSLSYNALLRHFWAWMGGETHDPKDGQHHLASVIWHAIALQYFERHKPEFDDRLISRPEVAGVEDDAGEDDRTGISYVIYCGADDHRDAIDELRGDPGTTGADEVDKDLVRGELGRIEIARFQDLTGNAANIKSEIPVFCESEEEDYMIGGGIEMSIAPDASDDALRAAANLLERRLREVRDAA